MRRAKHGLLRKDLFEHGLHAKIHREEELMRTHEEAVVDDAVDAS